MTEEVILEEHKDDGMPEYTSGHPKGLMTLFFSEMWERFCYYGMRVLLTLYLVKSLMKGDADAALIYGAYTGLVYAAPILGGKLADKFLGYRYAVMLGAILMAIGEFIILGGTEHMLMIGMGALIVGNGYFKANISTIVGDLYDNDDPRKDGGFTIFYMGINIGAFLSPFVAGTLGEKVGWPYGFLAAGIGMLIGTIWFYARRSTLNDLGMPPNKKEGQTELLRKDWMDILFYTIINFVLVLFVIKGIGSMPELVQSIITWVIGLGGLLFLILSIFKGTEGKTEWSRVFVILVLAVFNIVFWAGFEQAGGTFNLFAAENTDRMIGSWEIPTTWFQNINPIAIVLFAPLFSMLWIKLSAMKKNPRTPVKFAIGLLLGALAFYIMTQASNLASDGTLISPLWLVAVYVILTLGELMLSPIGLSMITKLSPSKITSIMMGVWMASFALGNYLAATLESILETYHFELYPFITFLMLGSAVALLLLSPVLNKLMKGIH